MQERFAVVNILNGRDQVLRLRVSFNKYPSAPALMAGNTLSSAAKLVRARIRAPGCWP